MSDARKPARWGLIVPWALFALLLAAYTGYWFALRAAALAEVDRAFAAARASGATASYRAARAEGYPLRLSLRFTDVAYAPVDRAWRFEAPAGTMHVNVSNPRHAILALDSPARWLTNSGEAYAITAPAAALSVRFAGDELARASLDLQGLRVRPQTGDGGFQAKRILAHLRPDARQDGAYQLALEIDALASATPVKGLVGLGRTIERLRAAIVLENAEALLAPNGAAAWLAKGGRARLEGLDLAWGPAQATGTGELGLDAERRLQGGLALTLTQPRAALLALADGAESQAAAAALRLAAGMAAGQETTEITITARDGALSIQGAPVRPLQPLFGGPG